MDFSLRKYFKHGLLVSFTYNYGSKYSYCHFTTLNKTYTLNNFVRTRCPGFKHLLRYQHVKESTYISGQKAVLVDGIILLHDSSDVIDRYDPVEIKFLIIDYYLHNKMFSCS